MVTDFGDDLNALDASTSEITFRSGADELDEYLEDDELDGAESEDESGSRDQSEDEDDETEPQLLEVNDQIRKLHSECLERGKKVFKKMKQQIEDAKPFILTLRDNIFRYRQGSSGNVIDFADDMLGMDGKPLGKLSWPQYCERVFDLSTKRISQILGAKDKSVKKEKTPVEKTKAFRQGWEKCNQQMSDWKRAQQAKGTIFKTDLPLPTFTAEPPRKKAFAEMLNSESTEANQSVAAEETAEDTVDDLAVFTYFQALKNDETAVIEMMQRILRHCGLANRVTIKTTEDGMRQAA
jgi:hypothetical protein